MGERGADNSLPTRVGWSVLAAVSVGGALGGTARYGVEQLVPVRADEFPWGTFTANIVGGFALGILAVLILGLWPAQRQLRPFLAIGFLASFTTFSTWMLQAYELADADQIGLAAAYLGGSVVAGLAVTGLGLLIGRAIVGRFRGPGAGLSGGLTDSGQS